VSTETIEEAQSENQLDHRVSPSSHQDIMSSFVLDSFTNLHQSSLIRLKRLQEEKNTDGPWPKCLYLQYEICEAYLLSQADDIWISRIYPGAYHYSRIVIRVDDNGITMTAPGRG
jgi:hypothetical protein